MHWQTKKRLVAGTIATGMVAAAAWTVADLAVNRGTERVPYTSVAEFDGVELRRYPETVRVQTTAPSERKAFWRLFRYIDGENAGGTAVSMTAPVQTDAGADQDVDEGTSIAMTAPVETRAAGTGNERGGTSIAMTAPVETTDAGDVTMSFFLPETFTPETAPEPTNEDVTLQVDPPRTLAVIEFSWWTPRVRVALKERRLRATLEDVGIEQVGEPRLLRYDAPFTPPWLRTNEVAVEVDSDSVRRALGNGG